MANPIGDSGVIMSSDLTFITNEPGKHLRERFGVLLGEDTRFFDCLVGYFFLSGGVYRTSKIRKYWKATT